jgi:hypothetical protein
MPLRGSPTPLRVLHPPSPPSPFPPCRLSAFYLARTLSDLPMDFALPTVLIIIVYFMGGLRYNALAFFGIYGVALLCMLVAQVGGAEVPGGRCWVAANAELRAMPDGGQESARGVVCGRAGRCRVGCAGWAVGGGQQRRMRCCALVHAGCDDELSPRWAGTSPCD